MKQALGIYIDATTLRTALVSTQGSRPHIEALETFNLYEPLEQREVLDQQKAGMKTEESRSRSKNPFGGEGLFQRTETIASIGDSNSNVDVIIKMLNLMCPRGAEIAFNLSDHFTFYKHLAAISESTPSRLRKAIWQTFTGDYHNEPKTENLGYIELADKSLFTLLHEDPLVFSSLLLESFALLRNNPPKIGLIDSTEFILAHEIIHNYTLGEQDHTAVILFTSGHTKVFFMRGQHIHSVLPTIYEGSESETVCDTAFAKILFEFDSGKLAVLTRIVLAGDIDRVHAEKFFKDKWPAAAVSRLEIVRAVFDEKLESLQGRTSTFALPIALALKALDDHPKPPYQHNFLPRRIKEKQSVYRIAWHGILLLCILFAAVMFLTVQSIKSMQKINGYRDEQTYLRQRLQQLANVADEVDSLRAEISKMEVGTAIIDSLNKRSIRWAPLIEAFSQAHAEAGPFSFIKLASQDGGRLNVDMELLHEEQVVRLERLIQKSMVTDVNKNKEADDRYIQVQFMCDAKRSE